MSKSLGNVIDPIDIIGGITLEDLNQQLLVGNLDPNEIERARAYQRSAFPNGIEECGTDALRFALVNYTTGGSDIAFEIKEIEAKRRFCNKIYQATNFALARLGEDFVARSTPLETSEVTAAIEARESSVAEGALYRYWVGQLCDTFIENSKPMLMPDVPERERKSAQQTLYTAVEGGLLLMHPIILFITEVLWQRLPRRQGDRTESIMVARYPEFEMALDAPQAAAEYEFLLDISAGIRSLLSRYDFKEASTILVQTYSRRAF